jgi:hypothetical protein
MRTPNPRALRHPHVHLRRKPLVRQAEHHQQIIFIRKRENCTRTACASPCIVAGATSRLSTCGKPESHVQCKRKQLILCIKDTMRKMDSCSCSNLYAHESVSIFLGLWSGISGIVALASNHMSQCAASYQMLMVLGIGLGVFSGLYLINCVISSEWKERCFPWLVSISAIFVFLLDCMLIEYHIRGNESLDCSGGHGTLRLIMIVSTVPFLFGLCFACAGVRQRRYGAQFYRPQAAAFQILL